MRYRLRTLLIVLAVGPPMLAGAWSAYREHVRRAEQLRQERSPSLMMTITPGLTIVEEEESLLGLELQE
jgi:hypothetical protein